MPVLAHTSSKSGRANDSRAVTDLFVGPVQISGVPQDAVPEFLAAVQRQVHNICGAAADILQSLRAEILCVFPLHVLVGALLLERVGLEQLDRGARRPPRLLAPVRMERAQSAGIAHTLLPVAR